MRVVVSVAVSTDYIVGCDGEEEEEEEEVLVLVVEAEQKFEEGIYDGYSPGFDRRL